MPVKMKRQDEILQKFFRNKTNEIRTGSHGVIAPHAVLRGSHREEVCREFLVEFLPRRYAVGRGMVFDSIGHFSRECDIVIWDDQNYPRLPEKGHTLFFADSVRCVIEIKSRWSSKEWTDTLKKTKVIRGLGPGSSDLIGLADRVLLIEHKVHALRMGEDLEGIIISPLKIAYASIFLEGGTSCTTGSIEESTSDPDYMLPDLTLLLEPGLIVEKMAIERNDKVKGWAGFRHMADDGLLAFALKLIDLLHDRSAQTENTMIFPEAFDLGLDSIPEDGFEYRLTRLPASVHPLFFRPNNGDAGD
jgi:hypothetical protein